jgi:hypothetical protein
LKLAADGKIIRVMFDTPTFEDFSDWTEWHLKKAETAGLNAANIVKARAAAAGALGSGRVIIGVLEAVHREFDGGVDAALGELKRVIGMELLDRNELRRITHDKLYLFTEKMKTLIRESEIHAPSSGVRHLVNESLAELDKKLVFCLRQFDVGFKVPPEPETIPSMKNNIKISNMYGGAIQQGNANSTQTTFSHISVKDAGNALADFEAKLTSAEIPDDKLLDIKDHIDTIKHQLAKSTPSQLILAEAFKSLRNMIEGIAAGAMTSPMVEATLNLGRCLGLG